MEELKLNETPVRTAKNFNINNIKLKNVSIPTEIEEFKNININCNNDVIVDTNINKKSIKYGVSDILFEQINNKANKNIRIITEGKKNDIQIAYKFDNKNINLIDNIEINFKEGTTSNVLIKYEGEENIDIYHNGIIKVSAENNSNANITIVNLLNKNANNFISIDNNIQKNAKINYCIIDFGAKNNVTNYYSDMIGNKSENNINTIYLGKENQIFDINYIVELKGKNAITNIEVQGALKDNATKHYKGTIDFKRGCTKSKGNENEFCMLLSDTAKSLALPMLLCDEDDVEGNHSSSAGKAEAAELFYIMSRGFSYKEAMKLIVKAKFNKIINKIPNEELKKEILNEIDKILD